MISLDSFNKAMPVVVVAAITSKVKGSRLALHLPVGSAGLPQESEIMPFQVLTIDQSRLDGYVGQLTGLQITALEEKLRLCWGL